MSLHPSNQGGLIQPLKLGVHGAGSQWGGYLGAGVCCWGSKNTKDEEEEEREEEEGSMLGYL